MNARQATRALPAGRALTVRAADGTPLHAEVFGPADGYPIVLTHGFVCAIRAWAYQIEELSTDFRVIAFDHRGHGRSGLPRRGGYSLNHLASDLDCVLEATLAPHERAVIAGHSMGGMTIQAWSQRYGHKVARRADAVALINTASGDLLRKIRFLSVPRGLSPARVMAGRTLISAVGGVPLPNAVRIPARYLVALMATGAEAHPDVVKLVYEMFAQTSPAGRGGCARMLVGEVGSRHLSLAGLTVPTLVIGSERDRLTPIGQSRKIARTAPNVVDLVELPGGHCSMLEQPAAVNAQLRALAESALARHELRRISS
ncbi:MULTISPECIES: alpha/beta fold hydrolase [Mycobacterium]|uniref:Non-heme haloperoxidase Hpx n=1 Tax=Mycobacterium kiyosense TaxID=2871094 RepID=A0A9P3Q3X3_9MYCO|nr:MULTISPECIES: alpha/beta hydrolase [Mycobacterium]BDB41043.1 non-heme haloperoxidase Hpx [Mycobacterium kiyosense]BDE12839.1 non-heme haloperoxidase Hpx [Mycobacterium sp. 20KCMC460]GLB82513.1 non-heme haloperoxidase Hpx [Mycobacterium kiyosense]GLB90282.1 non-heme haloperoxidase Hpx [Mycobacterium kiyosense]GLB93885.1 non-heme haloperoxidase Hpx [Mycobacterium kiyosense]